MKRLRVRSMGDYQGGAVTDIGGRIRRKAPNQPGPLTGTRIRILPGSASGHPGRYATLTGVYLHLGAYWARLESGPNTRPTETVVRPHEWEVVE